MQPPKLLQNTCRRLRRGLLLCGKMALRECLPPMMRAHTSGIRDGDIEGALLLIFLFTANSVWAGIPLKQVHPTARLSQERMRAYRYDQLADVHGRTYNLH